jgi:hypothetical protein
MKKHRSLNTTACTQIEPGQVYIVAMQLSSMQKRMSTQRFFAFRARYGASVVTCGRARWLTEIEGKYGDIETKQQGDRRSEGESEFCVELGGRNLIHSLVALRSVDSLIDGGIRRDRDGITLQLVLASTI